jgi:predicted DNA-binding protein
MPSEVISAKVTKEFKNRMDNVSQPDETSSETIRRLLEEAIEREEEKYYAVRRVLEIVAAMFAGLDVVAFLLFFANFGVMSPTGRFGMFSLILSFFAIAVAATMVLMTDFPEDINNFVINYVSPAERRLRSITTSLRR